MKRLYLLLAAVFMVLVLLPIFLDNYALGIFVMIFFWAYVGQSWNVLTGYTGHISLETSAEVVCAVVLNAPNHIPPQETTLV